MQSFPGSSRWLAVTLSSEALILSLSSGTEQFTGYSSQDLAGMPITHILADCSAFEVPFILKSAREWGSWSGEIEHRDRSGNSLKARGALTLLSSGEEQNGGYLLISNFDSAPDTRQDLTSADVAAKLRVIAHDLNNPLAIIMGYIQLIALDENCPGKTRADIEKLYSELQRVVLAVEQLRSYAISLYGTAGESPIAPQMNTSA
jgi:signal transduction histidine kinase